MKIIALSLLLPITLFLCPILNFHNTISIDKGLIAYYSFNSCDARDEGGNDSNGNLYGRTSCWCGIEGEGLLLDGRSSYIEFPGRVNQAFNTTDFTISFYVKTEQYSIFEQSLFSKREICDSTNMLDIRLNVHRKYIATEVFESNTKFYPRISPSYEENGWMHFALVRKGTFAYTYINGILQREGRRCSGVDISNSTIFSFSNSPCIGEGKARRFKGVLDELRVYERALSDEEILMLYLQNPIEKANSDCFS